MTIVAISGRTKIHALFGSPIQHSLSAVMFNEAFAKLSINRLYLPFEVRPDGLSGAVEAARALDFEGFNVTIPHKTRIIEFLDRVDASSKEKGSVNTVAKMDGTLVGFDTDGEGALRALKSYGFNPGQKQILLIGAGGSARALIQSIGVSNTIKILNRTREKAREIVDAAKGSAVITDGPLTKTSLERSIPGTDLLVNATPVQTTDILTQLNVPLDALKDVGWVFDLAYDKQAPIVSSKFGRISALEMLLQQAALSYEIWLESPAPMELMRLAMISHLGGDWR